MRLTLGRDASGADQPLFVAGPTPFEAVVTSDSREAASFLERVLGCGVVSLSGSACPSPFRAVATQFGGEMAYGRLETEEPAVVRFPGDAAVLVAHLAAGELQARTGSGEAVGVPPGGLVLVDGSLGAATLRFRGVLCAIRLSRAELRRAAAPVAGFGEFEVAFTGCRPMSNRVRRAWLDAATYVRRSLVLLPELATDPLRCTATSGLLAACTLQCFPHEITAPRGEPELSAAVRRALAVIDAHAQRALSVTDLARASGIGVRGLQAAFRRELGTTPLAQLREARLAGAHEQLRFPEFADDVRVATIAARWQFRSPGEFAARYRSRYGCTPSQTLRAAGVVGRGGVALRPSA